MKFSSGTYLPPPFGQGPTPKTLFHKGEHNIKFNGNMALVHCENYQQISTYFDTASKILSTLI